MATAISQQQHPGTKRITHVVVRSKGGEGVLGNIRCHRCCCRRHYLVALLGLFGLGLLSSYYRYNNSNNRLNRFVTFYTSSSYQKTYQHQQQQLEQQQLEQQHLRLIEKQLPLSQFLSEQNTSRQLCGVIPEAAPLANRFPQILSTSTTTTTTVQSQSHQYNNNHCRSKNAITYLIQKGQHSTYGRNSTALFLKSLDLLYQNYLSLYNHSDNVDVLLVHTGDHDQQDLDAFHARYNHTVHFLLIDLNNTEYWTLPRNVQNDDTSRWNSQRETVGYRHMIRWYATKLYDFIRDYAIVSNGQCQYRCLMRMDEDSFLLSPVQYDLFDFMYHHNYSYAFRLCSFELETNVWDAYMDYFDYCHIPPFDSTIPLRKVTTNLCGFYNNFFIIDHNVVMQPKVQHFLQWIDALGIMYRDRYNDLRIQSLMVYAFVPPERIHRFLDWSYEHMTLSKRCPIFGAVQAGYLDPNSSQHFDTFTKEHLFLDEKQQRRRRCPLRRIQMYQGSLSPTYSHLPSSEWFENYTGGQPRDRFQWDTLATGHVEKAHPGIDSG